MKNIIIRTNNLKETLRKYHHTIGITILLPIEKHPQINENVLYRYYSYSRYYYVTYIFNSSSAIFKRSIALSFQVSIDGVLKMAFF